FSRGRSGTGSNTPTKKNGCKEAASTSKGARTGKTAAAPKWAGHEEDSNRSRGIQEEIQDPRRQQGRGVLELLRRKDGATTAEIAKSDRLARPHDPGVRQRAC